MKQSYWDTDTESLRRFLALRARNLLARIGINSGMTYDEHFAPCIMPSFRKKARHL
jgi:hypothetical protein